MISVSLGGGQVGGLTDKLLALVDLPLPSVIEPLAQVRVGAIVDRWDLPEPDRAALRTFGLPRGPLLRPMPQADAEPTLTPNIAGEAERRVARADQRLYLLGIYGAKGVDSLAIRVGAVAGTGQVMGLRDRSITTDDVAEPLRFRYPDVNLPAVWHFNASVTAFVEVAWRWRAAVELLRAHPEPQYTAPEEEYKQYYAEIQRACDAFLDGLTSLDPTLGDPNVKSLWVETIENR